MPLFDEDLETTNGLPENAKKLKALMRAELGVDPLPETEAAVRALMSGEGVHGWPLPRSVDAPEPLAAQSGTRSGQLALKARGGGSPR